MNGSMRGQTSRDQAGARSQSGRTHEGTHAASASAFAPGPGAAGGVANILALQRAAGNRAVDGLLARMMERSSSSTIPAIPSGGRPLDNAVRAEMESRFGQDLSEVQVHTGAEAAVVAGSLEAKAYTVGNDVVFSQGRYAPSTAEGKRLLAHELAHVVQQRRGGPPPALAGETALEHSADEAAAQVARGSDVVAVTGASGVGVARQEDDKLPYWKRLNRLYNTVLDKAPAPVKQKIEEVNEQARAFTEAHGIGPQQINAGLASVEPVLSGAEAIVGVKPDSQNQAPDAARAPAPAPALPPSPSKSAPAPSSATGGSGTPLAASLSTAVLAGVLLGGVTPTTPGFPGEFDPANLDPEFLKFSDIPPGPIGGAGGVAGTGGTAAGAGAGSAGAGVEGAVAGAGTEGAVVAAGTEAAVVAAGTEAGTSLGAGLVTYAAVPAGAAAAVVSSGFLTGLFGPFALAYALEHSEELSQRPDPDELSKVGGAPSQADLSGDAGAPDQADLSGDAGAGQTIQLPSGQASTPAIDPNTGEPLYAPANQDQAQGIDPATGEAVQAPGAPGAEKLEAGPAGVGTSPRFQKVEGKPYEPPRETIPVKPSAAEEAILEEPGMGKRKTPGGKQPKEQTTRGTFGHKYYESLDQIDAETVDTIAKPNAESVVNTKLPTNLEKEHPIPVPGYPRGREPRADRVDWGEAFVYEIKPEALRAQGEVEAKQYAEWMNKYEARTDGKKWVGKCITYDASKLDALLRRIGYLPPKQSPVQRLRVDKDGNLVDLDKLEAAEQEAIEPEQAKRKKSSLPRPDK